MRPLLLAVLLLAPAPYEAVLDRVAARGADLKDLTADYEQQSVREGLKAPVVSRGSLLYRADPESGAAVLLKVTEPETAFIRVSARRLETYLPEDRQVEVVELSEEDAGARAVDATILLYGKPREFWERNFRISLAEKADPKDPDELVLEPRDAGLGRQVKEIRLWVDPETALPRKVRYRYDRGEEVTMVFGRVKPNSGLRASDLELHYPKDTEVIRAGGK